MWEALQRYSALPSEARRAFRRAAALLLRVRIALRTSGYKRTVLSLEQKLSRKKVLLQATSSKDEQVELICRMVSSARRYLPIPTSCLEESLVLWYLLRSRGIAGALKIGVRKDSGVFEAHAWVELDGVALNQHAEQHRHYSPFEREFAGNSSEPS